MGKIKIGMDVTASEFYVLSNLFCLNFYIITLIMYNMIYYIFDKDHWEAWTNFTASTDIQVCLSLITFS
jgi:hypothetical protein